MWLGGGLGWLCGRLRSAQKLLADRLALVAGGLRSAQKLLADRLALVD